MKHFFFFKNLKLYWRLSWEESILFYNGCCPFVWTQPTGITTIETSVYTLAVEIFLELSSYVVYLVAYHMVDVSIYNTYRPLLSLHFFFFFYHEAKAVCHSLYFCCCAQICRMINFITAAKPPNSGTKLYIPMLYTPSFT